MRRTLPLIRMNTCMQSQMYEELSHQTQHSRLLKLKKIIQYKSKSLIYKEIKPEKMLAIASEKIFEINYRKVSFEKIMKINLNYQL